MTHFQFPISDCQLRSVNRKRQSAIGNRKYLSGFTLTELLAALVVIVILLAILIPYLQNSREMSRRVQCSENLATIQKGLNAYFQDNRAYPRVVYDTRVPDTYVAFTGPDEEKPFDPQSKVQPNDVSASLWLLVRTECVKDPAVFVCPSSGGYPDLLTDDKGSPVARTARGNFRSRNNLTYSYAMPFASAENYAKPDFWPNEYAVLADINPGGEVNVDASRPYEEQGSINSPNHYGVGQFVLYGNGWVSWQTTPYCGKSNDNIYSIRRKSPTTEPTTLPANINGIITDKAGPVSVEDSYLVPTAR